MNVAELMRKDLRTCRPDDTLDVAAKLMSEHDCGSVPVVDAGGTLVGMLDRPRHLHGGLHAGKPLCDLRVDGAMARRVFACTPHDSLAEAEARRAAAPASGMPARRSP